MADVLALAHLRAKPQCYLRRLTPEVQAAIDQGDFRRIAPESPCPACGVSAIQHPAVERHEFLHYLCDGQLIKP